MKKRILSVLLALSMALTLLPGMAFAAGEAPTEKPVIDAAKDLYQVEVMCQEDSAHFWSYPSEHNWVSTPDLFAVGEIRANDLDNGTAEQYPYICPVKPADTMEDYLEKLNAKADGHRAVTVEADYPIAYYYWNSTDGWVLLRDKQPDEDVRFKDGTAEGTLRVHVTCAAEPEPGPGEGQPTTKPTVKEADLYQVEIVCQDKGAEGKGEHWWSAVGEVEWAYWVNDFTVGEIEANTAYQPDAYPWRCPVTPKGSLDDYLSKLNAKAGQTHELVTDTLPVAYYYYSEANGWEFIKNEEANPDCVVSTDGKNTWYFSIQATCVGVENVPETEWLTSLDVPGYDLFVKDPGVMPSTAGGRYLILAQSGVSGDTGVYALYLNPNMGWKPSDGVIKTQDDVAARLAMEGDELVGYLQLQDGSTARLTLDQLLVTVAATEAGFTVSNGGKYLNVDTGIAEAPADVTITAREGAAGAYILKGVGRFLTLFVWGQNGDNANWKTNFWGPRADQGASAAFGSSYIYFLHEHVDDGKAVAAYDAQGVEIQAADGSFTIPAGGCIMVDGEKTFTVPDFVQTLAVPEKRASTLKIDSEGGFGVMGCVITMLDGTTTSGIDRSGSAGGNVSYARTADNRLYFAGQGEMDNYSSSNTATPPWLSGIADRTLVSVSIGGGVTRVGDNAFKGASLTRLTLGDGVEAIGESAFESTRIETVDIPDSVTEIGVNAFKGCLGLRSVTVPAGVVTIGSNAFANCTRLRNVTVEGTLGSIPNGAFQAMSGHSQMNLVILGDNPATAYHDYEGMLPFLYQNGAIVYTHNQPDQSLVKAGGEDAYFAVVGDADLSGMELTCGVLPTLPAKGDVAFSGWQINDTTAAVPGGTPVSGQPVGTVFTAQWGGEFAVACTVTIDGVGYTVAQGQTMGDQMPADPTREGFRFTGWVDEAGAPFTAGTVITGNTVVTSTWTPIPVCTVTLDANGGVLGGQSAISIYEGERLELNRIPNVSRKGFTLDGWFTDDGERFLGAVITGDLTLTARWSEQDSQPEPSEPGGGTVVIIPPEEEPKDPLDTLPFVDVDRDAWYAEAVAYVYGEKLMQGTSELTFEPGRLLNRAMMAQILYNQAGRPAVSGDHGFTDVRPGAYYAKALTWCAANDVIKGYSDDVFGGEDVLTREQMVVMLHRYARLQDKAGNGDLTVLDAFSDAGSVSGWAADSVAWAVENGLLKGRGGSSLDPRAPITRAEAAAIVARYAELLA